MRMLLQGDTAEYLDAREDIFKAVSACETAIINLQAAVRQRVTGTAGPVSVELASQRHQEAHDALYAAVTRLLPARPRLAHGGSL